MKRVEEGTYQAVHRISLVLLACLPVGSAVGNTKATTHISPFFISSTSSLTLAAWASRRAAFFSACSRSFSAFFSAAVLRLRRFGAVGPASSLVLAWRRFLVAVTGASSPSAAALRLAGARRLVAGAASPLAAVLRLTDARRFGTDD